MVATTSNCTIPTKIEYIETTIKRCLDEAEQFINVGMYEAALNKVCKCLTNLIATNVLCKTDKEAIQKQVLNHSIAKQIFQEPFTKHSFDKPRGYSGDAVLLDYIYKIKSTSEKDSFLGRELHNVFNEATSCKSVRWRATHLAKLIDILHEQLKRRVNVLSIASGHLREIAYINDFENKVAVFEAIDQDVESNTTVREIYNYNNLKVLDESIHYVLGNKLVPNHYDFIYSAGLFDYLDDKTAKLMIAKMHQAIRPSGKMLICNFAPGLPEQGYMEIFMDWHLIYRTEAQVLDLTHEINQFIKPSDLHLYRDPECNVVYMEVEKL